MAVSYTHLDVYKRQAGYIPDMFARDQEDLALGYRRLFPEEETKRKKENRKKKSAHKRTRRAL